MEALQIIVPFLGVILGIFIGYFLKQAEYERKRQDELADREFARRKATRGTRIQEARDVVEMFSTLINHILNFVGILRVEKTMKGVRQQMEFFRKQVLSLPLIMHEALTKGSSIDILNDLELMSLRLELFLKMREPAERLLPIIEKLDTADEHNLEEMRKEIDLEGIVHNLQEANKIITEMKSRLDTLDEQ
jgi:hypothetical protein